MTNLLSPVSWAWQVYGATGAYLASKSAPATASTALEGLLFDLAPVAEQAVAEKGAAADQETISAHAVRSLDWGNLETHLEQKNHQVEGWTKKGDGERESFQTCLGHLLG